MDAREYELFYKSYFSQFFHYGLKFIKDKYIIEDAIQEVFLDIWKKLQQPKTIESPASYYFSAFRYILFSKIKEGAKTSQLPDYESEPEFSIDEKIIAAEINSEQAQKIQQAMNALTPRQREAIFLRFYAGLSFEDVSSVLGITVKATYKIISRGLASLKDSFVLCLYMLMLRLSY